jgi:hypothetical protein
MLNLIPISAITSSGMAKVETIACPLCDSQFSTDTAKAEHLDAKHPGWAMSMMSAFLRQVPRVNG